MSERISIFLPCAEQKREYLEQAVASVIGQTSPHWELLVGLDPQPPPWIPELFTRFAADGRIRCVFAERPGFASVLNAMLHAATTPFAGLLLSDDRWMPEAVETLLRHRARYPAVDFFHSSRRYIDARGVAAQTVMKSRRSFPIDHFKREGSPVKHLLCWRRELALAIGGMNEALSRHGCDDYDFPWRMAEAGAVFQSIDECLYEYRNHNDGPRLTTSTPLQEQVATIERMFRSHAVSEPETCAFLDRAVESYLPRAFVGRPSYDSDPPPPLACFREVSEGARARFVEKGFRSREFFPHRVYVVPRPGADGMQLAQDMCDVNDPAALRQLNLYATDTIAEFPAALFFEDDVMWHRQQLGLPGLVASANLVGQQDRLYVTLMYSDLVQRISRRREHKTRVENRFDGWAHLLVNAILAHAHDAGFEDVCFPTAESAIAHTDAAREVQPELFERVYDRTVQNRFSVTRAGGWWRAAVRENAGRFVPLERKLELLPFEEKTICIVHDVERGIGHRGIEDEFAAEADRRSPAALERMLAIEGEHGARVTYSVLGVFMAEVRAAIEQGDHALAFHSYEHIVSPAAPVLTQRRPSSRSAALLRRLGRIGERALRQSQRMRRTLGLRNAAPAAQDTDPVRAARDGVDFRELARCRQVDYRLKGYRPPQSRLTPGLHDRHLAFFNFEWLASSSYSLGIDRPTVANDVVKIPIELDDFDLHRGLLTYEDWERQALALVDAQDFVAIGLHDCYAEHWLAEYPRFLAKLAARGRLRTLDEVSDFTALSRARWR